MKTIYLALTQGARNARNFTAVTEDGLQLKGEVVWFPEHAYHVVYVYAVDGAEGLYESQSAVGYMRSDFEAATVDALSTITELVDRCTTEGPDVLRIGGAIV
jgi:hypothetical protein